MDALAGYESDEGESTDTDNNSVHSNSEKLKNLPATNTGEGQTDFVNGEEAPTSKSPSTKTLSRLSMETETIRDENEPTSKSEERELDRSLNAECTTREPPNGELNGDQAKTEPTTAVDHRSCSSSGGHAHNDHRRHRSRSRSRSKSGHHSSRSGSHSPIERNLKSRSKRSRSRDHSRSRSRDPKSRSHSRSPRRKHSSHHKYSERKFGRGSDSRKSRVTESHRSSRRRRSGSQSRRRASKSHSRERNKRRSRSRSHDRSSRRSRSRSRSRRCRRSRSRDYSSRHRSRSRSRDRNTKRPISGSEIKTTAKLQPVEAAAVAAAAATEAVRKTMEGCGETTSKLPLNSNVIGAGCQMTPQMAVQQAMAAVNAKAQQLTGIALPKYYNPAAVNPMKYAEQMQKRKLLWHCNKEKTNTQVVPASNNNWESTTFAQDQDGKMTAKFRKLMGIKATNLACEEPVGITNPNPPGAPGSEEQIRKQEEMFRKLDQQYEVARMSTHTHRGVGLGFTSQAHHLFPK